MNEEFSSTWEAIADSPRKGEIKKFRTDVIDGLCKFIEANGLTRAQAAKKLGVSQRRVSDLTRGCVDRFDTDGLVGMVAAAGMHIEMQIGKAA